MMHVAQNDLPFGRIGPCGMGTYPGMVQGEGHLPPRLRLFHDAAPMASNRRLLSGERS